MAKTFTAERVLEYPGGYTRSVGPVIGKFLTGLRDGKLLGVRLADGRVLVPPTEYDPATSEAVAAEGDHWIEVGPRGTVQAFTWVAQPRAGKHALDEAVRVRADPARRRRHRAVAHGRLRFRRRDPRRLARRAALAGRARRLRHRHRSVGAARRRRGARRPRRCDAPAEDEQPVTGITVPISLHVHAHRGAAPRRVTSKVWAKERSSAFRAPHSTEVYAGRGAPTRRPANRRRSKSKCGDTGCITTFCVVNVPGLSELAPEIPYVSAQILLDGADNTFFGLIRGCAGRRRAHGDAREGEVGRRAQARPHERSNGSSRPGSPTLPTSTYKDNL